MIFVDTGPLIARYLPRDQYHQLAVDSWRDLERNRWPMLTTNLVLSETLTLLGRRASYAFAAAKGRTLLASSRLQILHADAEDEQAALVWFEKLADQQVSFTDCLSFALMRRHRLKKAFSFDRHFSAAGFELWAGAISWVAETPAPYGAE
ncbi:MAG TPA: type II toxin-antitoxin system VapC family toxin [Thermoanaerobaculia bacterium]|nr:type II toxin-antitoxin system VapC family toxin [Thermoanaerobaculia bacterium]